jgi:hypothetical protein
MKYLKNLSEAKANAAKWRAFDGPTFTSSTYAGQQALPYVSAALKSGATLANGWINVLDDVPYRAVINRIEGENLIANASCDFVDGGDVTVTERVLSTKELAVNINLCKSTMRQGWQAAQTGNSLNSQMPIEFQDYVIGHVAGLVAEQVENSIWGGAQATGGEFEGFLTATTGHFTTDATVVDQALSGVIDASNIVAHLTSVIDAAPSEVVAKSDFALYVNPKTRFFYQQALGTAGYANDYQANAKPDNIFGYPIYSCPGITDNNIVATYTSNLNFGSNILSNLTEVRVLDMSELDGSDNIRFVMRFSAGTQHGVGSDIVWGVAS